MWASGLGSMTCGLGICGLRIQKSFISGSKFRGPPGFGFSAKVKGIMRALGRV